MLGCDVFIYGCLFFSEITTIASRHSFAFGKWDAVMSLNTTRFTPMAAKT